MSSLVSWLHQVLLLFHLCPSENEKNIVERNVSTSGVSIYFEAYLYNATSYTNTQWHLPPTHLGSSQRRPSTATEDEDEDSPSDSQTPEKVKKPKKVYCYVSPKVKAAWLLLACSPNVLSFQSLPFSFAPGLFRDTSNLAGKVYLVCACVNLLLHHLFLWLFISPEGPQDINLKDREWI